MDLSRLTLFRNDPQVAADVLEHALKGDMDAQFAAGLIYAEGRGVPLDLVQSFYWLSKAVEQGDADAKRLRVYVGTQMSDEEYAQARYLLDADEKSGRWEHLQPGAADDRRRH